MTWLPLTDLLLEARPDRQVALEPTLQHAQLQERALRLAAALQARSVARVALYLEDAGELAIALLGAWRAGVQVLLPADAQAQTRQRLADQVDLWLDDLSGLDAEPLPGARLLPEHCHLTLCTSGSSGEPKLIDKSLVQLANEVEALERLWGAHLGQATILGSVACQHIYGLLFRLLWPLCAGRPLYRRALPFPEDLQQASLAIARGRTSAEAGAAPDFAWIASPALLKRMGDNLDWPALSQVKQLFSSGGALPAEAAQTLHERLGQWPTEIYGSSETGGIGWRQGDSAWQPFPGIELSLDAAGALRIASPYLPAGHVEQSADAAEIGDDGRFVLRGRLERISLPMLEQALTGHDWVADARLGVIQEGRAFLGAVLALSPSGVHALRNQGRRTLTETLRRHLAEHCETIALPRRWRLLLELPYSSQGKLPQSQVDALLSAPRPTRVEPVSAEARDGEWLLQLQVPLDLAHFTGHFPQTPVLPGVVQVDWAQQLARQLISDLPPRFAGMEVLKFQQLVRPGDTLQLTLRFDTERGKLYFAYHNGEAACSSGRILLEPAHG
jgi:acyl-coenzyme A synthetase/AMP-(fatty) acid ligase/3-hydroxymyristoyl/3-hydroxydecanoyl-(acyl carrier protein) dehydratase